MFKFRCSIREFVVAGMFLMAVAAPVHGASLLHQYIFNGNADDQVAGGVNGTLAGNATASGGLLTLSRNGDIVTFGSNYLVPSAGSYSVLLNAEFTYDGDVHEFLSQGHSGGPGFYIGPYGGEMRVTDNYGWNATPGIGGCCTGIATPQDGLLHNYALVVSGTDAEFFIDGVSRGTRSGFSIDGVGAFTVIGEQFNGGEQFVGEISDVRIYGGALTGSEVATIAAADLNAPEPGTFALIAGALAAGAGMVRRRRKV